MHSAEEFHKLQPQNFGSTSEKLVLIQPSYEFILTPLFHQDVIVDFLSSRRLIVHVKPFLDIGD